MVLLDLMLLDLMLPDSDGWSCLRAREHERHLLAVPVLVMSAAGPTHGSCPECKEAERRELLR